MATDLPASTTEQELRTAGLTDVVRAQQYLRDLAGTGVSDADLALLAPSLLLALRASPDADRALAAFARWFGAVGNPAAYLQVLRRHPVALELFCLVTGCSQYFADLLTRQPEYFEIISNPGVRGGTRTAAAFYRDVSGAVDICQRLELKRDVLRRWKAREMLRIGVRDLIGLADMPSTAREFSNLADSCVQKSYEIALSTHQTSSVLPFAVIAMGKLGGQELNYSSDVDLMFVHGDALPHEVVLATGRRMDPLSYLNRLAETLIKTLAEETAGGHVFRVDMRLRPEGRFGPLTRSLAGFAAYYESWAENWERQALLKARFIAGDHALGQAFMAMVTPFVYRRYVTQSFLDEVRANKRRIEQKCALEGQTESNIKTGYGGIRDIEFIVQRLQLQYGGAQPRLRAAGTLPALQRLRHAGLLTDRQAHDLSDDYQFLRTLEHRLQLLQGFQTQTLPPAEDVQERARLARRMGFANASEFNAELQQRRDRVHNYLQHLFYLNNADNTNRSRSSDLDSNWVDLDELLDNIDAQAARQRLSERLEQAGFRNLPAALNALQLPMRGNEFGEMPPDTPIEFKAIAPRLLDLALRAADPDAALAGVEALALAVPNRAQLYASLDDSPEMLARLVTLAGASPPSIRRLCRHLEWLETLFNTEEVSQTQTDLTQELLARLGAAGGYEAQLDTTARFQQREMLRIGAQDIWEEIDVIGAMNALTDLAAAVLQALLHIGAEALIAAHPDPDFARATLERVAILGLGKLGGRELGYASDWDVIFVYDEPHARRTAARSAERFVLAEALVTRVTNAGKAMAPRGAQLELDLRLRPWGRKGALIHTLRGLAAYHRTAGETWERQAAVKARFVAGNPAVGRRAERILYAVSYGRGITPEEDAAVQAMKGRIEHERLKPEERDADLKLGWGGLSDVEWIAQRLQLLNGPQFPTLRQPSTLSALSALAAARLLDNAEADALTDAYLLLTRVRNAIWLQNNAGQDRFPADPARARALARQLGYLDTPRSDSATSLWDDVRAHMQETRRIFQLRFLPGPQQAGSPTSGTM
jgi:glutamate-ammonia-ligase adenylyltransferase